MGKDCSESGRAVIAFCGSARPNSLLLRRDLVLTYMFDHVLQREWSRTRTPAVCLGYTHPGGWWVPRSPGGNYTYYSCIQLFPVSFSGASRLSGAEEGFLRDRHEKSNGAKTRKTWVVPPSRVGRLIARRMQGRLALARCKHASVEGRDRIYSWLVERCAVHAR